MRSSSEIKRRLAEERGRAERLEREQPDRARAVARAIAADAEASVTKKLRAERDAGEREQHEAEEVVRVLEAELQAAKARELDDEQAALVALAEAGRECATEAVDALVRATRVAAVELLRLWDDARAIDQNVREAYKTAGRSLGAGDGVWWHRAGSIRALMLELDRFARWAPDASARAGGRGDFIDSVDGVRSDL